MEDVSRRTFLGLSALGVAGLVTSRGWSVSSVAPSGETELYRQFLDPGRECSIRPFWFWNGALDAGELRRQMKQMIEHGVFGAYAHNRDGLQTPYLSEAWWKVVGEALEAAHELGFSLCMVDEFEWPSGEARDYWQPGPQKSLVVKANPAFHMKRLRQTEQLVHGPGPLHLPLADGVAHVVVARPLGPGLLDGSTLQEVALKPGAKEITWTAPEGDWIVHSYILEDTIGPDHGSVDLMSREAVAEYIRIYYEEFHRRHGKHFGKAMPATFADHEGSFGGPLPWTPRLMETFQKRTGYSLVRVLPALTRDIGPQTEKVRCDLLDTVSELYGENFFQQVTDWCQKHSLEHSGHVWEESLYFGPAFQGDFFRILRSMSHPGCDTLEEWGRQSIWLKENASVADFERRHVVCENQGVQGEGSYLSPERMRRVSNGLGAWNVAEFIPHAFDYDLTRTNYPPDWFRSQPYLRWFKAYADQMRRISYMNRDSHEIAEILLLYPQVSVWGQAAPAFRTKRFDEILHDSTWSEDARETNARYTELKLLLSAERLAYQVADDHYLVEGKISGGTLAIADSRFKVLVLPPMSTIRRSTAQQVAAFIDGGGLVVALERLPTTSVESGRDDAALAALWKTRFETHQGSVPPLAADRGRGILLAGSESDLVRLLEQRIHRDAEILDGPGDHLFALRKSKAGAEFFWLVNDSPTPRVNLLHLPTRGRPERWDPVTGLRAPLFFETVAGGTRVRLRLEAWDAVYIVFTPASAPQPLSLKASNLDDFHIIDSTAQEVVVHVTSVLPPAGGSLTLVRDGKELHAAIAPHDAHAQLIEGPWEITVEAPEILAPYALAIADPGDLGLAARWQTKARADLPWGERWLSPMKYALPAWNVIGPFPNEQDLLVETHFPPESETVFTATYQGEDGVPLAWQQVHAERRTVESVSGFGEIGLVRLAGGSEGDTSHIVNYAAPLAIGSLKGTFYAQTFLYVPQAGSFDLLLATGSPRAVFVNGQQVYSRWVRPLYNVLDDAFADRVHVTLTAGWNSVLLKLLHNPDNAVDGRFFCRLASAGDRVVEEQRCSTRTYEVPQTPPESGFTWLRLDVPPLASALLTPPFRYGATVFVDGSEAAESHTIPLPSGASEVTLRVDAREILDTPFRFTTARRSLDLGTWMRPGLRNFSGEMTYEKDVTISAELLREGLLLDCGEVGVVAEAWINDQYIGSRSWAPFAFNLSHHARPGTNRIRVRVANTEGNARAVGPSRANLANIDVSGWHGPARLVPFIDRDIKLT